MNINFLTIILTSATLLLMLLGFIVTLIKLGRQTNTSDVESIRAETEFQTKNLIAMDRLISMGDEILKNQIEHTRLFEKLFSTHDKFFNNDVHNSILKNQEKHLENQAKHTEMLEKLFSEVDKET